VTQSATRLRGERAKVCKRYGGLLINKFLIINAYSTIVFPPKLTIIYACFLLAIVIVSFFFFRHRALYLTEPVLFSFLDIVHCIWLNLLYSAAGSADLTRSLTCGADSCVSGPTWCDVTSGDQGSLYPSMFKVLSLISLFFN
jgi:hypothetical protein